MASNFDQAQGLRDMVLKESGVPKLVTVTSGKGGVGKSSMTVNIALALSHMGLKVLVVDADFGLANIDVMLGITVKYNLSHLLKGQRTMDEIIQQGYQGVKFISGGSGVYDLLSMDSSRVEKLVDGLMYMKGPVDVILFDTGAGINENVLRLVQASQEYIVVTTPEPTAILDAYALVKTICKYDYAPPVRLIMNKADSKREAENAILGFKNIIRKFLDMDIEALGYVLFDAEITRSIKQQTPVMISNPQGATAKSVMAIAQNLMHISQSTTQENQSPLAKLFARFRR